MHSFPVSLVRPIFFLSLAALVTSCTTLQREGVNANQASQKINHVVVIYAENHSFDNMYGLFPGANGIANATAAQKTQLDHDGKPLKELVVFDHHGVPDPQFPRMPNGPFRIDAPPMNRSPNQIVPSPIHAFFHNQEQINGGQNNLFAAMSTVVGMCLHASAHQCAGIYARAIRR